MIIWYIPLVAIAYAIGEQAADILKSEFWLWVSGYKYLELLKDNLLVLQEIDVLMG